MDNELVVLSPEKTILTYPLAGVGSRITAHLVDGIILFAVMMALQLLAGILVVSGLVVLLGLLPILLVALPFLYFILFEGLWNGQTLGKKVCGLRVRMADGTAIRFGAALSRNLMRPADFLPFFYFVGILAIFTTNRSQRLGDLVSNTVVIRERRSQPRFVPAPHVVGYHPFEQHVGDLHGMTQEEYDALRRFCDRFPELPAHIQDRLLQEVWHPIAVRRNVRPIPNVHPIYLAEATVMRYGRMHGLL